MDLQLRPRRPVECQVDCICGSDAYAAALGTITLTSQVLGRPDRCIHALDALERKYTASTVTQAVKHHTQRQLLDVAPYSTRFRAMW
jgi:hypothetical protein